MKKPPFGKRSGLLSEFREPRVQDALRLNPAEESTRDTTAPRPITPRQRVLLVLEYMGLPPE